MYAIVIVHQNGRKHLFGRIRRSPKGDVYVVWAEDESCLNLGTGSNPHASYHASGQVHSKSHNVSFFEKIRQRPDDCFMGTEPLEATNADRGLSLTLPIFSGSVDGVFEIDAAQIRECENPSITVDLSEPGVSPIRQTGDDRVLAERTFDDEGPWIIVSLVVPPKIR